MTIKSIAAHHYNEFKRKEKTDLDNAEGVEYDDEFKKNYYCFTCLQYYPPANKLLCGATNFNRDFLKTFDPETKQYDDMKYYDFDDDGYAAKIHRSLEVGHDGKIYGATSTLYSIKDRNKTPGGKLFRFDYASREYELLSIPKEHEYIQTITLDPDREMIYGFLYPVFEFFAYSIKENSLKYLQYMASIPHLSALDDNGGYWGTWGTQHVLFRYDPDTNAVTFYDHGFPTPCRSLMYHNAGPIDRALNIGDGYIYIAHESAELYRLDPQTAALDYLGKAYPSIRMPGLAKGPDGNLYCAGGADWDCRLAVYDMKKGAFRNLGAIRDTTTGEKCFRVHDLVSIGNSLYIGETDCSDRSNHVWEIEMDY